MANGFVLIKDLAFPFPVSKGMYKLEEIDTNAVAIQI